MQPHVDRTAAVLTLVSSRCFDHGLDDCSLVAVEFWLLALVAAWRDKM